MEKIEKNIFLSKIKIKLEVRIFTWVSNGIVNNEYYLNWCENFLKVKNNEIKLHLFLYSNFSLY